MDQLPLPLLKLIDSYVELFDHFAFIAVSKRTYRLKIDYRKSWSEFQGKIYNFDLRFLEYLIQHRQFTDDRIISEGNIECVKLFVSIADINLDFGLRRACVKGDIEIVNLVIEKGAKDWDWGLFGACKGGNIEIVHMMIQKGADDWNWGLNGACLGGHIEIAHLMIEKGATNWNRGLYGACMNDNIGAADLMIQHGATKCVYCGGRKHQF